MNFSIQTTGCETKVRGALSQLRTELVSRGVDAETCSNAEIAMAEALNNVAEHAYANISPGPVDISVKLEGSRIKFVLRDWGASMPDSQLPQGSLPDSNVPREDLPEGGFGWFIIGTLAESISYSHSNGENRLTLFLPQN